MTAAVESVSVRAIKYYPGNARRGDVAAIASSLEANGQYKPLLVQRSTGHVLAGNHTLRAARSLKWKQVDVLYLDVSDEEARRIVLIDNRSADSATYDNAALLKLLRDAEADGGLLGTGYSDDDLTKLLEGAFDPTERVGVSGDTTPIKKPKKPRSRLGDIYELGEHRLMCGDASDASDVAALMGDERAHIAVTSPPYASQRTYDDESEFKPIKPDDFGRWFGGIAENVWSALADDGSMFLNIAAHAEDGERHLYVKRLVLQLHDAGWKFIDEFCWVDTKNGVPGKWPNRFKSAWEPVFHLAKVATGWTLNHQANGTHSSAAFDYLRGHEKSGTGSRLLGKKTAGAERSGAALPSNVLQIASSSRSEHSAMFPVELPEWFIRAYTNPGDTVLDPFMGGGTTLIAAANTERRAFGLEISPAYCDVIVDRWQRHTGKKAKLRRD